MRYFLSISIAMIFLTAHSSASDSDSLTPVRHIELQTSGKVILHRGASQEISYEGNSGYPNAKVEIDGDRMIIRSMPAGEMEVTLTGLESVDISGFGSVTADSTFAGERLKLKISGNGKIILPVNYKTVVADISGVGKVQLSGQTDSLRLRISGSGKIDASQLKVSKCSASISGLGKCIVDVRDELETEISGSGKVDYVTKPSKIETEISGVGKVEMITGPVYVDVRDTVVLSWGDVDILMVERKGSKEKSAKKSKPVFPLLELGLNPYSQGGASVGWNAPQLITEKSVSVGLNFYQKSWEIGKSNLWVTTRIGIQWNNYRFAGGNTRILKGDSIVGFDYLSNRIDTIGGSINPYTSRDFTKSKLTMSYLTVPLMLNYVTSRKPARAFTIGAGVVGGLRLGSHSKQVYTENGQKGKEKYRSDYFLNPFRYGLRGSIGYRNFSLFGEYYFSELFIPGKGPEVTPLNFGVSIIGFNL